MWQISVAPVTVAHLGNYLGQIGGSTNQPEMNKFENFTTISCTNVQIERGSILSENCQLVYLGPHNAGHFSHMGCLPIGPICPNFNSFLYKTQIERGPFLEQNCKLMYLRPHNVSCFKQIGVSANRPKMDQFWNFLTISCKK